MRQHPIPQNVLTVEFKLFTRFTVKEFAYIATGVILGGLFIYLWTEDRLPGIIAFPSFAMFSGIGLILGLVPIQDQPADKILSNYIKAINKPTLRVWQGEEMKLRFGKSINDLGWAEFTKQLSYKGEWYGCEVEKIDRFFPSSKTCSKCGWVKQDLSLGDRVWECPACLAEHDRDINAAKNILEYGRVDRNICAGRATCSLNRETQRE